MMRNAMMMVLVLGATGWGLLDVSVSRAAVIIETSGDDDPVSNGFDPLAGGGSSGATVGPGLDEEAHWSIDSPTGSGARYNYTPTTADLSDPNGWTATMRAKAVVADRSFMVQFNLSDGDGTSGSTWVMHLIDGTNLTPPNGPGEMGVYAGDSPALDGFGGTQLSTLDPTAAYHTYQMYYDPSGDGGNGIMEYYIDGGLVGSNTRAEVRELPELSRRTFGWGKGSSPISDGHYSFVRLETGKNIFSAVTCDFDGGGCGFSDINLLMSQGNLTVGVPVNVGNSQFDLNNDNTLNEADITVWLDEAGTSRGYSSAFRRGDTDNLENDFDPNMGTRTVDISDFQNFLDGFTGVGSTWQVGNFNGDSGVDITDFSNHFLPNFSAVAGGTYGPGQSIPEPSTILLLVLGGMVLVGLVAERTRR